jgi:hypothetical protein
VTELTGWLWRIVIISLVVFALGIILVGIGGALLMRDLFRKSMPAV